MTAEGGTTGGGLVGGGVAGGEEGAGELAGGLDGAEGTFAPGTCVPDNSRFNSAASAFVFGMLTTKERSGFTLLVSNRLYDATPTLLPCTKAILVE